MEDVKGEMEEDGRQEARQQEAGQGFRLSDPDSFPIIIRREKQVKALKAYSAS